DAAQQQNQQSSRVQNFPQRLRTEAHPSRKGKGGFLARLRHIHQKRPTAGVQGSFPYAQARPARLSTNNNKSLEGRKAMKFKLFFGFLVGAVLLNSIAALAAAGAVYTLSNSSSGNAVLVFSRTASGQLAPAAMFQTGGLGSGKGLGN